MSREMAVIALGIWVIVLPHLGVPGSWHTIITTITGLAIIAVGLYVRAAMLGGAARRSSHHPFIESAAPHDDIRPHSNDHSEQPQ
ncbi:MAG: hypothetical protein V4436_01780 [Patescibacteria group bacterium]